MKMEPTKQTKLRQLETGGRATVVVGGLRTAFVRSLGLFEDCEAVDLATQLVNGLLVRSKVLPEEISELVVGSVFSSLQDLNIARIVSSNAKLLNAATYLKPYVLVWISSDYWVYGCNRC